MSAMSAVGGLLVIWGFIISVFGQLARPWKWMRLDRPMVRRGDRFSLARQRHALRMGPYLRRAGPALLIVGAVLFVIGRFV